MLELVVIVAGLLVLILGFVALVSSEFREMLNYVPLLLSLAFFASLKFAIDAVDIAIHLMHWFGRVLVLLIFMAASLVLLDNIFAVFDMNLLEPQGAVFKLTRLFDDRITWVASTAVVATTVALGHFKGLDLNYRKRIDELKNKQ